MSTPKTTRPPARRFLRSGWSRKLAVALGLLVGLLLVVVVVELARWRALPQTPPPHAERGPRVGSPEAVEALRSLARWRSEVPVAGVSVCVGVRGVEVWCSTSGYADLADSQPLTADSSLRLGSVSKPLTALLMARLAERGEVDLDRPIGEVAPDLPEHLHAITPRQLASHTAGIRHYHGWRLAWTPHETLSRTPYPSVAASLAPFAGDPLLFRPGSGFCYSTHGYTLLGSVLERAAGVSFGELLRREIAEPLGLEATVLDRPGQRPGWARPYEIKAGHYRNALEVDSSRAWPGGGIRSSASELARLVSSLPGGELIEPATLETMLTPQTLADGTDNPQRYALGWRILHTQDFLGGRDSYRLAHHGGVASGGSAFVLLFPDQALSVAALANSRCHSGPLAELALEIAEPFMKRRVEE